MKESFDEITNLFNTKKKTSYLYTITTFNMLPLFNVGDNVVLSSSDFYYPNDIVFFKKNNRYVLGRIKYIKNNCFGIWFDSSTKVIYPIAVEQIAAKIKCYRRKKKPYILLDFTSLRYKIYLLIWNNLLIRRFCLIFLNNKIRRFKKSQKEAIEQRKKRKKVEEKYPG